MLITILLLTGYAFNYSNAASIITLPISFSNKSLESDHSFRNESNVDDEDFRTGYVKLRPGSKIYFYTTEDENLVIGPKLQSGDDISIVLLNQDDDQRKYSQFKNYVQTDVYSVLKSGVLVPKRSKRHYAETTDKCNKCVYQSVKPTYYIKGFKNILIPVDVLYTKSKQEELFNTDNLEKTIEEPNSWRTDLKISGFKPLSEEAEEQKLITPKSSNWSPLKSSSRSRSSPLNLIDPEIEHPSITDEDVSPDKNCNGDVILFVLENSGMFKRVPSDPFLPLGMNLSYSLMKNLLLKPKFLVNSGVELSYITGPNGDLIPHSNNIHKVVAEEGTSVSFMLSKNGGLIPVEEEKDENETISYYFDGKLVHRSRQFTETFSNATSILINDKKVQIFENDKKELESEPVHKTKARHLQKRSTYYNNNYERNGCPACSHSGTEPAGGGERVMEFEPVNSRGQPLVRPPLPEPPVSNHKPEIMPPIMKSPRKINYEGGPRGGMYPHSHPPPPSPPPISPPAPAENYPEPPPMEQGPPEWENQPLRPRTDIFTFDEKGTRIRLIPEITDNNDVVIYKLTCKGNLVRYPSCKEPDFGFNIHFQILLDEFVLVPRIQDNKPFLITYVLQENGDLIPAEGNANTFRKAPGSLIYYMLGKNNILFPVQQIIDLDGNVSFFYQDHFLLKMKDSTEKPLHFSTKGAPLFAFFNGFTMITISSRPRLNPARGSNWRQLKPTETDDGPPKTMYLTGPKGELIKLSPYKNKQGSTIVYELDGNGIFYRSPKDKKKCIILKSYILLKEGILLPSNDTSGYVYMMSKNGDLFPYLYPDGKIEAPLAASLKYVLCEKGILLPIKLEIIDNYICYLFRDVIVYKERVYCKSCLDRLDEEQIDFTSGAKKSSCDIQTKEIDKRVVDFKLFINKDGEYVFYEKEDKILKRHPSETVPPYLKYTMGSFEVKPDGSLHQIRYQDPSEYVINLMLEPNGDLLEDTRNLIKVKSDYYILDIKGNLISVEVKKTKRHLHFYKNNIRVCRIRKPETVTPKVEVLSDEEKVHLPLGKDPMGLMNDPIPVKAENGNDTRSLYIPIPLKSLSIAEPGDTCTECGDKKKFEMFKDTLKQFSKGTSLPLALELELTDDIMEELKNWATKCDKVLSRREIPEELKKYLSNMSILSQKKENVEAR